MSNDEKDDCKSRCAPHDIACDRIGPHRTHGHPPTPPHGSRGGLGGCAWSTSPIGIGGGDAVFAAVGGAGGSAIFGPGHEAPGQTVVSGGNGGFGVGGGGSTSLTGDVTVHHDPRWTEADIKAAFRHQFGAGRDADNFEGLWADFRSKLP